MSAARLTAAADRRHLWWMFLAFGAFVTALYVFVPPLKGSPLVINGLGLYGLVAMVAGIRFYRPRARAAWWLFVFGRVPVLGRRRLHVQHPDRVQRDGAVPVVRRRGVPHDVPGPDGRDHAPRPSPHPACRRPGSGRRADHDAGAGARLRDHPDRPVRARQHARARAQARLDRLPDGRHHPARRRHPAGRRRRQAQARLLPADRRDRVDAGHRRHLRRADAAQRLQPPAVAGRGLDLLLPVLGGRGAPPLDAGAVGRRGRSRVQAHPVATGAARRRHPGRARARDHQGNPDPQLGPAGRRRRFRGDVLPGRRAHDRSGPTAREVGCTRARAERRRWPAGGGERSAGHRERRASGGCRLRQGPRRRPRVPDLRR